MNLALQQRNDLSPVNLALSKVEMSPKFELDRSQLFRLAFLKLTFELSLVEFNDLTSMEFSVNSKTPLTCCKESKLTSSKKMLLCI